MKRRIPTAWLTGARSAVESGRLDGCPLEYEVTVDTDSWGIPRISARNRTDLFAAQGWVHASARLWQMESLRRFAAGRLSEIAGERMLELDHFARIAGFPDVCRRAVEGLSESSRRDVEAYIGGVNAFIEKNRKSLPLEFRSAGLEPEPWTCADATANLAVNSWYLQTNYLEEVLAIRTRCKVNRRQWDALMPGMSAFDGEELPEDAYFESLRNRRTGRFLPATYSFYKEFDFICGASNNWITADGPGGKPLLANDPHLGVQLPQIWYACGLRCPGTDILGVGMPGFPGIIIGRTPEVSWGFTNVMTDIVDLYVVPVDPDGLSCRVNGREHPLEARDEHYILPGGGEEVRRVFMSPHGPLITELTPDVDAAVALKWYGTLEDGAIRDETADGILAFTGVRSVADLRKCASRLGSIGQNIVAGDVRGDIIWQATGSIPRRRGYSGRLPADGGGDHDWTGFVPFENMPREDNPGRGWIATANHRAVKAGAEVIPTRAWAQPWRYRRIAGKLESMQAFTPEAFADLQNDRMSTRPAHILPALLTGDFSDPKAAGLAALLAGWNGECAVDSVGCLVFNSLPKNFCEVLLRDCLGDDLDLYFTLLPFFITVIEAAVAEPDVIGLFPDPSGKARTLHQVTEEALIMTHDELSAEFGPIPAKWRWGRRHRLFYRHPGSRKGFTSWLLDRGPWPAGGDWTTVNVCGFSILSSPGEATTIPSMRFISSLEDRNANRLCLPLGQSGRPGHRHYDDFAGKYIRGEYVPFPMDPPEGGSRLVLAP